MKSLKQNSIVKGNLLYKTFTFLPVFLTFVFLLLTCFNNPTNAIDMQSSDYQLKYTNINITSGNKESDGYKLSDTVGQLAAGEFASSGYIIKAGFQYLREALPFRFTVSNVYVDLGTLTPNVFSTGNTTLTVTYGSARQYQVTAVEKGKLRTLDSINVITDTKCDGGNNTCTESQAKIWNLKTAYGFGYNISGQDIPDDFLNQNFFRPFADSTTAESPSVVMSNPRRVAKSRQSTMTFNVNISNLQPAGSYQTIINFVATPSY